MKKTLIKLIVILDDALLVLGMICISIGLFLLYIPIGWIGTGILLCLAGVLFAKGSVNR